MAQETNVFNTTSLICSLAVQLIQTDEDFTVNGRTHNHPPTHTHTHTHTHAHTHTYTHTEPARSISKWFMMCLLSSYSFFAATEESKLVIV